MTPEARPLIRYLGAVMAGLAGTLVVALALSFLLGFFIVYLSPKPAQIDQPFPLYVFILAVPAPLGVTDFRSTFSAATLIYVLAFLWSSLQPRPLPASLKASLKRGPAGILENTLLTSATTFAALVVIVSALTLLQESVGVKTGALPETEPVQDFISIGFGPLPEEIGFRLTIIGLAAWVVAARETGSPLRVLWRPGLALGGSRAAKLTVYSALALSSLVFGYAHVLYGAPHWSWGKFTTATISGLVLGLLYIKYSFLAPLLVHWGFNYGSTAYYYVDKLWGVKALSEGFSFMVVFAGVFWLIVLVYFLVSRMLHHQNSGVKGSVVVGLAADVRPGSK